VFLAKPATGNAGHVGSSITSTTALVPLPPSINTGRALVELLFFRQLAFDDRIGSSVELAGSASDGAASLAIIAKSLGPRSY